MNKQALGRLFLGATRPENVSGVQRQAKLYDIGATVPSDGATGYAKGCFFIQTDGSTGTTLYVNEGTSASADFNASNLGALTATAAEINSAADVSAQSALISPATVISSTAEKVATSVVRTGGIVISTIAIDLTGLKSTTTLNDIIGDTGVCYIGSLTAAVNGTIYKAELDVGEVPAGGVTDIDVATATVATGAYDADVTGLTGYAALMTAGGALAVGTPKPFTALPDTASTQYLYLAAGAGGTAATYTAGRIIIRLWGIV